jgi:tetratricopeptide (TPR) repeat protein
MSDFLARIFGKSASQAARTSGDQSPSVNYHGNGSVNISYGQSHADADRRQEELLSAIARDKGVPVAPLQAVLARLGVLNVTVDDIPARLQAAATRLLELEKTLAQPIQGDATAQAAREEARRLIDLGDLVAAEATLRQGRQEARQRREDSQRIEATMAADEARLAKLALRYRDAAALFAEAADLVRFDAKASWAYLLEQAAALYLQGKEFGDIAALAESITVHKQALALAPRDSEPLDWAITQNSLGGTLQTLSERDGNRTRLEEAVTAYRAALEEYTRESAPLVWAKIQNNLGNALQTLGRPEEAIIAYRSALEEETRDSTPLDWAATQHNLGGALRALGAREAGTARHREAVIAFLEALKIRTRDLVPLDWARTQDALGGVLTEFGEKEASLEVLEAAVIAYRAALEERTRERVPPSWAMTQHNLGGALAALGRLAQDTALLDQAASAFRAALEERTRERAPLQWANSQFGLGNCLATLAEHSLTPGPILADAITHMQNAADGYRQVGHPHYTFIAEQRLAELKAQAQ